MRCPDTNRVFFSNRRQRTAPQDDKCWGSGGRIGELRRTGELFELYGEPEWLEGGAKFGPNATKPGWLARLFYCGTGSMVFFPIFDPECQNLVEILILSATFHSLRCVFFRWRFFANLSESRFTPRGHRPTAQNFYITMARFSSSCMSTGRAQPAISTRPAASSASLGETP